MMHALLDHLPQMVRELRVLWVLVKGYVLANLMFITGFGLLDPTSKIYQHLRHPTASWDELLLTVLCIAMVFLYTDLVLYDKSREGRRHWKFEKIVPFVYMLIGALYLAMGFFAATVDGTGSVLLVVAYLLNAALVGGAAFAMKLRLSWSAE